MTRLRVWFVFSILSLASSGLFAFLVAMSRTPFGYKYLPPQYFHYALVGHVDLSIVLYLLGFSILLWNKFFSSEGSILSPAFSFSGLGLIFFSVLFSLGRPVINNYIPVLDHPIFYGGLFMFFLGVTLEILRFFKEASSSVFSRDGIRSGLSVAVLVALIMIASFPISYIKAAPTGDIHIFFERFFWIPGHIQQIIYGAMLIGLWYYILYLEEKRQTEIGFLRFVNLFLLFSAIALFFVPVFYHDTLSSGARLIAFYSFAIGLGIPIFLHIFYIIRRASFTYTTASLSLLFSLILYILGALIAYLGLRGEDLRIPAHYHGAITSLTIALMGITYSLFGELGYRNIKEVVGKVQVSLFGLGMTLFVIGLYLAGKAGAPRKIFGIPADDIVTLTGLSVMGVGSILAVAGGILYIVLIFMSIFRRSVTQEE